MIEDHVKLKCLGRELALRKAAYPRWVNQGRMKPEVAAYEIEIIEAIIDDYKRRAANNDGR